MPHSPLSPHLAFIHSRLPAWLLKATPVQRRTLEQRIRCSHASTRRLALALAPIQDVAGFCRPLLEDALKHWYPDATLPAVDQARVWHLRRDPTWLEAAMQNFDADAQPKLYEDARVIHRSSLDARRFVAGVRNLDLGRRYHCHLAEHIDTDTFRSLLRQQDHAAFAAALSMAHLQGHIDDLGAAIGATVLSGFAEPARQPLHCSFLSLFGCALDGPLLIHIDPQRQLDACLLYLPGHDREPLRQHASLQAAARYLTQLLWQQQERDFFMRYVSLAEQPRFSVRLRATLYPRYPYAQLHAEPPVLEPGERFSWLQRLFPAPTDLWQETLDKNARLHFNHTAWRKDAFSERARTRVERKLADAATLAVPVARRDADAQLARIEGWLGAGLTLLNVAGLFVPGLGEVMMVVGGAQLVDEFLEGVHAANEGDADAAICHLFAVFENLAQFAALGAASRFVEPPGILHGWQRIGDSSQERLWPADLSPFARPRPWPEGQPCDSQGLQRWQGQAWLERNGAALPLQRAADRSWRLAPGKGLKHQPLLQGNGQGTWLLEHDRPLAWDTSTLLEQLGPAASGLDSAQLDQALRCSGYDAATLRKRLLDHHPLPALLLDSLEVFGGKPLPVAGEPQVASVLARDFPGLSPRARAQILAQASARDFLQLQKSGRLPLPIAETARLFLRESRISKALSAFQTTGGTLTDRDTLAFATLQRLPGWTATLGIELREGRLHGAVINRAGPLGKTTKVVVRSADGYTAYDEHDNELSNRGNLFEALLHALPDSERDALGIDVHDAQGLRDRLFDQAARNRWQAATDLGMQPIRPLYRQPSRLPDDPRQGYRLSGRGRGRLSDDELFDQLFPASPGRDREMLRLRLRYQAGDQPGAFARLLEQLQANYQRLDLALQRWVHDPEGIPVGRLEQRRGVRQTVAERIRSAWRREDPDEPSDNIDHVALTLELHQLDQLPTVSVPLPHVRQLTLNGLTLVHDTGLGELLRAFPGVRDLDLGENALSQLPIELGEMSELLTLDLTANNIDLESEHNLAILERLNTLRLLNLTDAVQGLPVAALNRLSRLPSLNWLQADLNELVFDAEHFQALQRWPALRRLQLGQNDIVLNDESRAALAGLNHLEVLHLYDNPLFLAPDVTGWNALQHLDLQNTGINLWPEGLAGLMRREPTALRRLDLSGNVLVDAPDLQGSAYARAIGENQAEFAYSFDNNPFNAAARQRLEQAGFEVHQSPRASGEWSGQWPAELQALVAESAQDPRWQALHALFDRLPGTAEYLQSPAAFDRRMRHVLRTLVAGEGDSDWGRAQLQQQINDLLADAGQQCVDQASLLFQQIETDVQLWQTVSRAEPGAGNEQVAVSAVTGLYRQRLLDARIGELYQARVARRRALGAATTTAQREAAPPLQRDDDISDTLLSEPDFLLDELEMALHARMHLRQRLGLPTQPATIMYDYLARLSEATLQQLAVAVEAQANAANLAQWLIDQRFWPAWLRRLAPDAFEAMAQQWAGASEYFDALASPGGRNGDYAGPPVPEAFIAALERDIGHVPGLVWRLQGRLQRTDLNAAAFAGFDPSLLDRVGGAMLNARQHADAALVRQLTEALLQAHMSTPRQVQ
ncbi:DUF6543 domain-containing protein [Pantoea sp. Cy-639]|uniref:dermonecrotic toxin domain-containing protein n=1 Tax=Pantoea sp. Cy-639 TaxID=2608360 RepID=UPI00141ED0F3|nr:DUF6543 domain-containing protein [Pantoea sp. Cy-639]NIF18556.1 hypothetical protein [Pantoea sp. Cy-639]